MSATEVVYPSNLPKWFSCNDGQMGGNMVVRAYAAHQHDYRIGIFIYR
ncbi:hypothetical protein Q3V23_03445 [Streptomyces sp. VNUA116]|nr:hypothetical protein [Streptomyces sp. VNUA116]WKU43206.1 hypothetical protein Q3V23_03445 [Streptomyces sp. VNUA116]